VYTGFWWDMGEGGNLENPDVDGRIILRWIYRKLGGGAWSGLIWRGIGTGGGYS